MGSIDFKSKFEQLFGEEMIEFAPTLRDVAPGLVGSEEGEVKELRKGRKAVSARSFRNPRGRSPAAGVRRVNTPAVSGQRGGYQPPLPAPPVAPGETIRPPGSPGTELPPVLGPDQPYDPVTDTGLYTGPIQGSIGYGEPTGTRGDSHQGIGSDSPYEEAGGSYYGQDLTGGTSPGSIQGGGRGFGEDVARANVAQDQSTPEQRALGSSLVGAAIGNPLEGAISGAVQGGIPGAVQGVLGPVVGAMTSPLGAVNAINTIGGNIRSGMSNLDAQEQMRENDMIPSDVDSVAALKAGQQATGSTGLVQGLISDITSPLTGAQTQAEEAYDAQYSNLEQQGAFGPPRPDPAIAEAAAAAERAEQDRISDLQSRLAKAQNRYKNMSSKMRDNHGASLVRREIRDLETQLGIGRTGGFTGSRLGDRREDRSGGLFGGNDGYNTGGGDYGGASRGKSGTIGGL